MAGIAITGDANIDYLDFSLLYDMSGVSALPFLVVTNQSTGGDLDACAWWIEWKSPSGNYIHQGTSITPDFPIATPFTVFNTDTENIIWPQPQGHVEWGIYDAILYVYSPDSDTIYSLKKQVNICAPHGNIGTVSNNFGVANIKHAVMCKELIISAADNTLYVYSGITGTSQTGYPKWLMHYPPLNDDTVTQPDDIELSEASSVIFPTLVNGTGQYIDFTNIEEYALDNDITLIFKYKKRIIFDVWCNIDIAPLMCAYQAYIHEFQSCNKNSQDYNLRLAQYNMINSKMILLLSSMMQYDASCCSVDIHKLIDEIKVLGGFDCCCYNEGAGNTLLNANIGTQNWDQVLARQGQFTDNRFADLQSYTMLFKRGNTSIMILADDKITHGWDNDVRFILDNNLKKISYKTGGFNVNLDTNLLTTARTRREPNKDGTYAMTSDIPTGAVGVYGSTLIDGTVAGNNTVFTPTARFILVDIINEIITNTGSSLQCTFNIGITASAYTDFISSQNVASVDAVGEYRWKYTIDNNAPVVPSGTPIICRVTVPITATAYTFRQHILGFYLP